MVTCYINIAVCNIKLEDYQEALNACNEALSLDQNNIKALYRKAIALT